MLSARLAGDSFDGVFHRRSPLRQLLKAGFTLVELVVVILVLGILAGLAFPKLLGMGARAEKAAEDEVVRRIRDGIELYSLEQSPSGNAAYPHQLGDLGSPETCDADTPGFVNVLRKGVTDGKWIKTSEETYRGPTGAVYRYNKAEGTFREVKGLQLENGTLTPVLEELEP